MKGREHAFNMKIRWLYAMPTILLVGLLTSCGTDSSSSSSQGGSYKETKTMVLDILKSDDGKKAIKSASQGSGEGSSQAQGKDKSQIKLLSTGDSAQLQLAVKDVLTADQNNKFLQEMMKDPKFAGDFAKAIQSQTKQMYKDLLKDPEYQKQVMDLMKNPEYEKMVLDTMKSAQYRQQMMTVIQESMQSPLFRADMVNMMQTAMKQQSLPGQSSGSSSSGGGGSDKEKSGGKNDKSTQKKDGGGDGGDSGS
jgi:spore germination protein D